MKLSFERKILMGFFANLAVLATLGGLYFLKMRQKDINPNASTLNLTFIVLFSISIVLLFVVLMIIRRQAAAREKSESLLADNQHLLQSIMDNTSNPVFIRKLNGEYIFANKEYLKLFQVSIDRVIGKTDEDFLPVEQALIFRDSDLDVVKQNRELKVEQTLKIDGSEHTYLAVKFPFYDAAGRIDAVGSILTDITERKNEEVQLRIGEKFFNISLDILIITSGDKLIKVNPSLVSLLGYNQEEITGKSILEFTNQLDLELTRESLLHLSQGAKSINFENRLLSKNGNNNWISWTGVYDPESKNSYLIGHVITDRIKSDLNLKTFKKFFEISFDGMVVANNEHFVKVNPAFTKMLGYEEKEMYEKPFLEFNHPDDIERAKEAVARLIQGETIVNFEVRLRCKDGTYKWLDFNANLDPESKLLYGAARDIDERIRLEEEKKKTHEQLYENEQKLRVVLENIGDGVVVANHEKKVIMANEMANEILGVESNDNLSGNLSERYELFFPDEKTLFPSQNLPIELAFHGKSSDDVDVVLWNQQANVKKRVLLSGRPIVNKDNNVIAAVLTIKDMSKYKKMEEDLREAENKYKNIIGFKRG